MGYLKSTLNSSNRTKLVEAAQLAASGPSESHVEGPLGAGSQPWIPPVITKSQEEYIAKKLQARVKQVAEQKRKEERYKPAVEQKLHPAVASRYL